MGRTATPKCLEGLRRERVVVVEGGGEGGVGRGGGGGGGINLELSAVYLICLLSNP